MKRKYRIREAVDGFIVEWFYKGSTSPSGDFTVPSHWQYEAKYSTVDEARKHVRLQQNPVIIQL